MTAETARTTIIHRIEVRPREGFGDVRGAAALREVTALGDGEGGLPERIDHAAVYLVEGPEDAALAARLADELLADPVTQQATVIAGEARRGASIGGARGGLVSIIEVHPLPGVTDPAAESIEAVAERLIGLRVRVRTGSRWEFHGVDADRAESLVRRALANPVVHSLHRGPHHPAAFPAPRPHGDAIRDVPLLGLDDAALERLSREAHLFLSLDEMRAIRGHYRALGREPREIELETIAQTWSEHCVHKTLKSTIRYREGDVEAMPLGPQVSGGAARPGHERLADGTIVIRNLLRSTIAAATHELMAEGIDWCLSVFVDNAGVIAFDDLHAVCFKCETHNHPSAIEPYGGAATGVGGCIRDVMGTGLSARPIASTDVFCVAWPRRPSAARRPDEGSRSVVPAGALDPARILRQVVAGVRDYGNRMGIPTVAGAVWFDDDYIGNPLVYCGCIGVMPRNLVRGEVRPGDRIVVVGGRTGRDGIHGATFSSAELTETHADEFSHAVQIGNAITQKKVLDALMAMRDDPRGCLYDAITDCGAGGFSSAVGEMGREHGAEVHLDRAPLKYEGLSPTEAWISEAQERMVLAVPPAKLDAVIAHCEAHQVEWCDLGQFGCRLDGPSGPEPHLRLLWRGAEVGRLSTTFLDEALPMPQREASFAAPKRASATAESGAAVAVQDLLPALLRHPNIASKHWIVRQYDHEVQGGSVVKPFVGERQEGPADGAVLLPVRGSLRGLAVGCGLATGLRDDPRAMALAAIDECVRNLVCLGADPARCAILDNFSWPSCRDAANLGALVRAAEGCYDGAKAYRTPFISGKDSLNNQFVAEGGEVIQIPPTLLISGMAIVEDVRRCVTSDLKAPGNLLVLVGPRSRSLRGSHAGRLTERDCGDLPLVDLALGPAVARAVSAAIAAGTIRSAHDCADGGLAVAVAEMAIGGGFGAVIDARALDGAPAPAARSSGAPPKGSVIDEALLAELFGEWPSRYLLEVPEEALGRFRAALAGSAPAAAIPHAVIGRVVADRRLILGEVSWTLDELRAAWRGTLDW
ncbi:MAG TPA: AIR synthase-related protein [Phycisphaerales bacterium]|nr:AIR synthase-related protein [Phycisphaerales bacterium]HMP38686.1 AIR synthase-related protein [Phycisphaerales bacterium]